MKMKIKDDASQFSDRRCPSESSEENWSRFLETSPREPTRTYQTSHMTSVARTHTLKFSYSKEIVSLWFVDHQIFLIDFEKWRMVWFQSKQRQPLSSQLCRKNFALQKLIKLIFNILRAAPETALPPAGHRWTLQLHRYFLILCKLIFFFFYSLHEMCL